jgi:rhomboid protease GluP
VVETRRSAYLIPLELFVDEVGPQALAEELTRRVQSLPEGESLMELARQRRDLVERVVSVRPIATQALLGILVVLFANQILSGSLQLQELAFGLVRWGANVPTLVREGEAFRLVTANFLHAHMPHLLVNGVALYFLGRLMERVLGTVRYLVVFLLSGLAAQLTTAYVSGFIFPSSGASGAIFGLLGALAWVNWRFRHELPLGLRQPRRVWVIIAVANLAMIPVLFVLGLGRIDVFAHGGGLIGGAAVCGFFVRRGLEVGKPPTSYARAVALALVVLFAVGMTQGIVYAARFDDERREVVAQQMLANLDADAASLNNLAWMVVIDPRTTGPTLARAEAAARRAVEQVAPTPGAGGFEESAYRDTLATVLYRRGSFDEAVAMERQAFALRPDALLASQLARFLAARLDRDGPMLLAGARDDVTLAFSGEDEDGEPEAIRLTTGSLAPGGTVLAVLRRGDQHLGLLRIEVGRGAAAESHLPIGDGVGESLAGSRVRLDVALLDATAPADIEAGTARSKLWDHDPEVDVLP